MNTSSRWHPVAAGAIRSAISLVLLVAVGCSGSGSSTDPSTGTGSAVDPASTATSPSPTPAPEPAPLGRIVVSKDACTVHGVESSIPAGAVALTIVNKTDASAVANMSKILEGGTYEKLEAHIAKEIRLAEAGKPGLGHPSYAPPSFDLFVDAGASDTLIGEVSAGTYAIVCGLTYEKVGEVRPSGVVGPYRVG